MLTRKLELYRYYVWKHQGPATLVSKPMPLDDDELRTRRRSVTAFVRKHGGKVLRLRTNLKANALELVVRGPVALFEAIPASEVTTFIRQGRTS